MPELISIDIKKSSRICVARGMLKESSQPPSQSMFTLVCTYLDSQGELAASLFIVVGLCPVCQSRYRYRRFATKCFLCSCVVCISEVTVVLGTLGTLGQSGHSWELLGTLGTLGCIRGVYRYYLSIGIDTPTFPCERDWCRTMIARTVGADEHLAGDLHHDFHGRAKWMAARGGGGAKQLRRGGGGGGGGGVCFSWWVGG